MFQYGSDTQKNNHSELSNELPDEIEIIPFKKNKNKKQEKRDHDYADETHQRRLQIGDAAFQKFFEMINDPCGDFSNFVQLKEVEQENFWEYSGNWSLLIKKDLILDDNKRMDLYLTPSEILNLTPAILDAAEPISFGASLEEQQQRFAKAYKKLSDPNNYAKAQAFLDQLKYLKEQKSPLSFRKMIDSNLDSLTYELKSNEKEADYDFCSSHLPLTKSNFDHFGEQALMVVEAGLSLAHAKAREARNVTEETDKKLLLTEAITYTLFAGHYLLDIYTSGHVNVPLKQLVNLMNGHKLDENPGFETSLSTKNLMAILFAKKMHEKCHDKPVRLRPQRVTKEEETKTPSRWDDLEEGEGYEAWNESEDCERSNQDDCRADSNKAETDESLNKNEEGEGCCQFYDFSNEQSCEAIALALNDLFLIFMNQESNQPLFIDGLRKIFNDIYKQETSKTKNPLFVVNEDKELEVRLFKIFYDVNIKNDGIEKTLNAQETQSLLINLEKLGCRFR